MVRGGDERAVTVQIGAVLLLAILFSALALYQVNAVPVENEAVEIDHNRAVHDEMQELRNAIRTAGTSGDSQPTAVTLGTQYPSRSLATNPPNPTGTLETSDPGTLEIENAQVTEPVGVYDEAELANRLLGPHETRTLSYEPGYNEYRSAPTTRIEHSLAFNEFGETAVVLPGTDQRLVTDDAITIVLIDGTLSSTSSGSVTVDPIVDGPTAPVPIERTGDPIRITVPTETPSAWNETFEDDETVTVAGYDDATGELAIELGNDEYDLHVARAVVGDGDDPGNEFGEIERSTGGGSGDDRLPGPRVEVEINDSEVDYGDDLEIEMTIDNRGQPNDLRGGVALVEADWLIEGESLAGDVDLTDSTSDVDDRNVSIPTDGLDTGEEYTVSVGARDTRGIEAPVRGTATFEIDEDDEDDGDDGDGGDEPPSLELVGSPWTAGDDHSEVVFTIRNVGGETAEIDGVSLDSTTSDAVQVNDPSGPEVNFSTGGHLESGDGPTDAIEINGERNELDETATLEPNETTDVTLAEFEDDPGGGGRGDRVDVRNSELGVTMYDGDREHGFALAIENWAAGDATIDEDRSSSVYATGSVDVVEASVTGHVHAVEDVSVISSQISGDLEAGGSVDIDGWNVAGSVVGVESVHVADATVSGDVCSYGDISLDGSTVSGDVISVTGEVTSDGSTVDGETREDVGGTC
ncbi:hypothetical protein [Natrarchaeobius chitinivorans]|uniref:Uncharacterized protein n=1 Tax=Natrarchaeobius chitinivorans TaxID=1679083 RepID=A0A3N6MAM6_NATCH|nr:hypothetical protein [Natrarchaeobius chitinivorans]RQG97714.1 hypothetical protein EA473_00395 [Natrarchaeobius chitinivorans]